MAYLSFSISCLLLTSLLFVCNADMHIYEAGKDGKPGPKLTNGMVFCPKEFSSRGFSIKCDASKYARSARFFVNGKMVRREGAKPYFINGDRNGHIRKWKDWELFKGENKEISCLQSDGTTETVTISLICDNGGPVDMTASPSPPSSQLPRVSHTPSPSPVKDAMEKYPGDLLLHPAGTIGNSYLKATDGMIFCPEEFPFGEFAVECVGSDTANRAVFYVNGAKVKAESAYPYFIAGDSKKKGANAWSGYPAGEPFSLGCQLNDGTTNTVTMTVKCDDTNEPEPSGDEMPDGGVKTSKTGCVVIDPRYTELSENWEKTETGVVFRSHVEGTYVAKAGKFPLHYEFTAPLTAQYAFVLDMTTSHNTEHNDVWAQFPEYGFQLMRGGVVHPDKGKGKDWIKVYHNSNGRDTVSSSVDFNAHSISTQIELQAGNTYKVWLSGRSSKLTVHKIIFFPCLGYDCQRGRLWNKFLAACEAL